MASLSIAASSINSFSDNFSSSFSKANVSISSDSGGGAGLGIDSGKSISESDQIKRAGADKDFKLERIIAKFRSGKKLTSGELAYLSKKLPAMYQKVVGIIERREQLEKRLAQAETKEEAQEIMMNEMQSVATACANSDDDFERESMVNQMIDAYNVAVGKEDYKEKPKTEQQPEGIMGIDSGLTDVVKVESPLVSDNEDTGDTGRIDPISFSGGSVDKTIYTVQGTIKNEEENKKGRRLDVAL
ncbi:MAG: hypothetical protein LBV33_04740 [Lachnospiraceae bacterium]|jgi:hypothetical protein|nr:hypothetical protein [Lachnospiraceae bacterium]